MLEKMLAFTIYGAAQTVASATNVTRGDCERSKCSDGNRPGVIDTENVAYHPTSVMNTIAKILLFGASMALVLSRASSQSTNTSDDGVSCVSVVDALLDRSPCYQVAYSFTMNGNTSIEANTVNVAVVVDGSGSISSNFFSTESSDSINWSEWRKEKEFAKNIVNAFSERNLFENGGTASYVQFSTSVISSASFTTLEDFIDFVDEDEHGSGGTNIDVGMAEANELLAENPSTATYMFVITDGAGYLNTAPADAAAAGTIVFAVGVGSIPEDTLLKITNGSDDAFFDVENFDELDGTLDDILRDDRTSVVTCEASNVEIKIEFSTSVISADTNTEGTGGSHATISGRTVTFTADTLEDSSTEFLTWLDACENADDDELITSLSYNDDEGNVPDTAFAVSPRLSEYDGDFPEPAPSAIKAATAISALAIVGFLTIFIGNLMVPSTLGNLAASTVGTQIGSVVPGKKLEPYTGKGDLRGVPGPQTRAPPGGSHLNERQTQTVNTVDEGGGESAGTYDPNSRVIPGGIGLGKHLGRTVNNTVGEGDGGSAGTHDPNSSVTPGGPGLSEHLARTMNTAIEGGGGSAGTNDPNVRVTPDGSGLGNHLPRTVNTAVEGGGGSAGTNDPNSRVNPGGPGGPGGPGLGCNPKRTVNIIDDGDDEPANNSSKRRPSVTLAFMLMKQLQFLAMLSLVESIVSRYSWFGNFVRALRWLNLWSPPDDKGPDLCDDDVKISDLDARVTVYNLVLILSILLAVLFVHIIVVSAIEAFWLTMKYITAGLHKCHGETEEELAKRLERVPDIDGMFSSRGPLAKCREISRSVWLYFPHIELAFLFFAFDGTVAAQVSALDNSDCPSVFIPSILALMLYPLLMFVTTWRTIRVRVHPNDYLVFRYYDETYYTKYMNEIEGDTHLKKLLTSTWRGESLFGWADRGHWETVQIKSDQRLEAEWNWFRIGFEPMFADYTKSGTWFILISLFEWAATACVGALVEDSVTQLLLLLALQVALLCVLLCLKPFANWMVNWLEVGMVSANIITVVLEGMCAISFEEERQPQWVIGIETTLQIIMLVTVIVQVYIDTAIVFWGGVRGRMQKLSFAIRQRRDQQIDPEEKKRQRMVLRYTFLKWIPGWFDMFNHNVVACARDMWRGLSRSGEPRDGTPYQANDDHVDKGFGGDWPNDDFKEGQNAAQTPDGDSQKTHLRPPPPSYEQAKQMDELRKGEKKT